MVGVEQHDDIKRCLCQQEGDVLRTRRHGGGTMR